MLRTYVLFGLAAAGFGFGLFVSNRTNATVPVSLPVAPPAASPYARTIAGAGIVEARSENIAIGSPLAGIVTRVHVKVGQEVNANDPLFELDPRTLRAELGYKQAALSAAASRVARLEALPRKEEIDPAKARVEAARAALSDAEYQYSIATKVALPGAVSPEDLSRRRNAVDSARARLTEAESQLSLLLAGAWKPDLEVARAEVASARADLDRTATELDRLVVRAPIRGQALRIDVRPGEFAPAGLRANPLLVFGDTSRLHARVDIDEADIWRFRADGKAVAQLRGNSRLQAPLRFERIEPYVIPKRSLTGESAERVDTRVLQVLYSFERGALPVQVGEQVDVFLEVSDDAAETQPSAATRAVPGDNR